MAVLLNNRFRILRALGGGSQGSVFLAQDSQSPETRPVALKAVTADQRESLIREFERLCALSHPGLSQVYGLYKSDLPLGALPAGFLYFTSAFVEGSDLNSDVQAVFGLERVDLLLNICAQLTSALSHLHAHDLIHNDIKPDNLLRSTDDERVVLLDLGLCGSPGTQQPRGSMAYMAPEALAGVVDFRSDLYSLGATMAELALGERFFPQREAKDLVAAILASGSAQVAERFAAYPEEMVQLMQGLLASDPSRRPSGANALLANISRVREALQLAPLALEASAHFSRPEFVGRANELAVLAEFLHAHASQEPLAQRVRVVGVRGSGRRRLISEALLRHQAGQARKSRPALRCFSGSLEELWPASARSAVELVTHYAQHCDAPALLVITDDEDPRVDEVLAATIPPHLLLIATRQSSAQSIDPEIALAGLSKGDSSHLCRSLCTRAIPQAWLSEAHELSLGLPGRISELMQTAFLLDPNFEDAASALVSNGTLGASLLRRVDALAPSAREAVEFLAVAQASHTVASLSKALQLSPQAVSVLCEELVEAGMLRSKQHSYQFSSAEYASLIEASLPPSRRRALHRSALHIGEADLTPYQRACHLLVVGPAKEACSAALLAIAERASAGRHDQALLLCQSSAKQMTGKLASEHAALTAEIALTTGDYGIAKEYAEKARRSRNAALQRRGTQALARCAQHSGDLAQATQLLASLVERDAKDAGARANYAKALCAQGDFVSALAQATKGIDDSTPLEERFLSHEVAGLANLYLGNVEDVAEHFDSLPRIAEEGQNMRLLGRAQGLRGMLAQRKGELVTAATLYADAAAKSLASGASHAAAVFNLNSATVEQRSARYAAALDSLQSALRQLGRSSTPFQMAAAHCNRGNVLLALGELAAAKEEAITAQALAATASEPRIHYYAFILLGDVAMRSHSLSDAASHYQDALEIADENQLSDGLLARLALQEVQAQSGSGNAEEMRKRHQGDSAEQMAKSLASHARVLLLLGEMNAEVAQELEELCLRLQEEHDLDLGWQVAVLAARALQALGDESGLARALARAKDVFQTVIALTPEAYLAGLRTHPEAQILESLAQAKKTELTMARQDGPALPILRLLSLSRRLNSELRMDALLDDVIDTAVELSRAERAFLLLRTEAGELELRVARNIDRQDLAEEQQVSRSIAEKVARTGQVILTVDAEQDGRFGASLSVAALQLRSILAVPFRVKSRIVGTLYLDHRFRRGAFDDQAVEVVRELAGIAAVALENARLTSGIRQRQAKIDSLNRRLEARLESTEAELAATRAKIPGGSTAAGFSKIVGDSPALREVLALAERAADCDLPVVIFGESGTGKELLARAIHENSDRREQAFVALNCGAVPDGLLEAELFGHRKGAFTGADKARQGLFRVADGGTLFLDEIADTSLTMQSKLLRALQDGEIRPLGSEETLHVNIRVLCASNKRLESLVANGSFREDLYYRLKVLSINVPPLSERRGDIEVIAHSILERLGVNTSLSRAALRSLQAHPWPGNVRELENELTRAYALSDSDTIEARHLSPGLQTPPADRLPVQADANAGLRLKPQVEALERELVAQAMRETGGNQSKAADLLGLSRYGLQKKLQRYGIARADYAS